MNTKQLIALSMIALSGTAAFAGEIVPVQDRFQATRSRAEVKAEVLQARAAGVINFAGYEGDASVAGGPAAVAKSTLTREEVRAQAVRVRRVSAAVEPMAGA